jgi:hypothetical protein
MGGGLFRQRKFALARVDAVEVIQFQIVQGGFHGRSKGRSIGIFDFESEPFSIFDEKKIKFCTRLNLPKIAFFQCRMKLQNNLFNCETFPKRT